MLKFRFRLEAVKAVRKMKEDEALKAMGEAQNFYQAALDHKASLLDSLARSLERREKFSESSVNPNVFQLENDFILGTKARIVHSDQSILRAKRRLDKSMRNYILARQQRKIMDKLEEKELSLFKKKLIKYEQKNDDDLNLMRSRMRGRQE